MSTLLAHREWVRRLARSLVRDDASADDVEQRTWLTALRSPPHDAGRARAWLARVVRNQALDSFRAEGRRDVHQRAAARADSVRPAADVVAEAESQKRVVVAVCGLAEPYRTTMLLRFYEDLPPRDVAARMDVPVETVRTRIRRGAELVRAQLGGDRSAWLEALTPLAAARTAGGLVMKGSTKAAIVTVLVLAAVGALGWMAVEVNRGEIEAASANSSPGSPAKTLAGRAGAQPSRTPRNRSTEPAGDTANAAPTPLADAAPVGATKPAVPPAEAAHTARAVSVSSPPRPSGLPAATPAPWNTDELLELLAKPATPGIPRNELADDGPAFARGFVLRRSGEVVDPLRADPKAAIADGSRIVFPAGCHRWDTTALCRNTYETFPKDLVIEGAGMDATLVVPSASLVAAGKVGVITFRNLTIHCDDSCLLVVGFNAVHLDHVRMIGFDSAGSSVTQMGAGEMFRGQALALLAEDCRFESGFGSKPGQIWWFLGTSPAGSVQKGWLTIARFERCKFLGPFEKPRFSVFLTSPPAATVYSQCDLVDCAPADRGAIEHPEETPPTWSATYLRFEDCRVTYAPASDGTPRKRRDVSELNPAWTMPRMDAPK
jgi:RNA polymerase sigma-70 factor (ECF subfamily)